MYFRTRFVQNEDPAKIRQKMQILFLVSASVKNRVPAIFKGFRDDLEGVFVLYLRPCFVQNEDPAEIRQKLQILFFLVSALVENHVPAIFK